MEKVQIVNVEEKTGKTGKHYYQIQLGDGRKGSSFNPKFLEVKGKEIDIEVVQNGAYLNFDLPKGEAALPQKENIKLGIAVAVLSNPGLDFEKGLEICEKYYQWVIS